MTTSREETLTLLTEAEEALRGIERGMYPWQSLKGRVGQLELNALSTAGLLRLAAEGLAKLADGSPEMAEAEKTLEGVIIRTEAIARNLHPRDTVCTRAGTLRYEAASCAEWTAAVLRAVRG